MFTLTGNITDYIFPLVKGIKKRVDIMDTKNWLELHF